MESVPARNKIRHAYAIGCGSAFCRLKLYSAGNITLETREPTAPKFITRPKFPLRVYREVDHDEGFSFINRIFRRRIARPSGPRPIGRRQARQSAFRDVLQRGSAKAVRPRHALSALVLVSRLAENVR